MQVVIVKKITFVLMTAARRFLFILISSSIPVLAKADGMKGLEAMFEMYSGVCIFLIITGMLVLMFAPDKKILNVFCGSVNVLAGLPIVSLVSDWGLEQEFTTPLLCLLIGIILLIRVIGKGKKQSL